MWDGHFTNILIEIRVQPFYVNGFFCLSSDLKGSSGLSSYLLMKTSCLMLKLVELNFFASFNADDQSKTYVSNISKYTFKLLR